MLRLLLDEHLSPDIAEGLHRKNKALTVYSLAQWEGGFFLGLSDEVILEEATAQKLTLVTYDRKTIPSLLKRWGEAGHDHGDVIFVDDKTISSSDFGGLIYALQNLYMDASQWDWTNRVCFLRR